MLTSQPAHAAGWVDDLLGWFSDFFVVGSTGEPIDSITPAPATAAPAGTPGQLPPLSFPDSDTLAIAANWPPESADVPGDLQRYERLQRESVLLTDPADGLPLTVRRLRVVYQTDRRPAHLLRILRQYADVLEAPYSPRSAGTVVTRPGLKTIIVAVSDGGARGKPWFLKFIDRPRFSATLLHFGDVRQIPKVPAGWSALHTPLYVKEGQIILAQALYGAELIDGRLKEATPAYAADTGYRLRAGASGFRLPEHLGIDRSALERVDYEINRGIRYRAMPGAQLAILKGGQVVYQKAYGHHTYRRQAVDNGDLYDLASVTKAAATTLAVMKLYDTGRIDLKARVRDYLPDLKRRVPGSYRIDQLLTHHSGLQAGIPIAPWLSREFAASGNSAAFDVELGPNRWLDGRVPAWIRGGLSGKLNYTKRPTYAYSDLNFYLLQLVVESITERTLAEYVAEEFYTPMGLGRLSYRPNRSFPNHQSVPTIQENWMRGGLLRGYVHDEAAALLGGVAGHAGLFGNASDLARLFQLLNNGGTFNGREYLRPQTVATFTARGPYNYRALGFDRLYGRSKEARTLGVGEHTVGHLGYTGTSVWADRENDLVFVFLTNRVHPDPNNRRLQKMNVRARVRRSIYRAMNSYEVES